MHCARPLPVTTPSLCLSGRLAVTVLYPYPIQPDTAVPTLVRPLSVPAECLYRIVSLHTVPAFGPDFLHLPRVRYRMKQLPLLCPVKGA